MGNKIKRDYVQREVKNIADPEVKKLLDLYYSALSSIDTEFSYWYTRRWDELDGNVLTIRRAEALKSAFSHLTPNIYPGEKLVMQKAYYYRGSFPMQWVSLRFLQGEKAKVAASCGENVMASGGGNVTKDFDNVLSVAGKFGMRKEEKPALDKITESWSGRSVEDIIKDNQNKLPDYDFKHRLMEAKISFDDAGYTFVQGRETMNLYYPLQYGLGELINLIAKKRDEVAGLAGGDGVSGMDRFYYYQSVITVIEGIQKWILNYGKLAKKLAAKEKNQEYKKNYEDLEEILNHIAYHKPRTFREAFQLFHTMHIACLNEDPICGVSPGRMGQILFPWFEQDIEAGRITEEEVIELFEMHRVKLTCVDIFASENLVGGANSGNTYNNLSVGGVKKDGSSAANRLEYLIIEAGIRCATPQPTLTCLYDEKLPEKFLLKCIECNKSGVGYPAWINNQNSQQILLKQFGSEGMNAEDARAAAIGGCLAVAPGTFHEIELNGKKYDIPGGAGLTTLGGALALALPKILEAVLFNGMDARTNERIFEPHNSSLETYDELFEQFKNYYTQTITTILKHSNFQMDITRKNDMSIINSFMKPDCLKKGLHNGQKGYRYNSTLMVIGSGTITLVNSLAAIKKIVYEDKSYSLDELREALVNNFGYLEADEIGSFSVNDQKKKEDVSKYDDIHQACLEAPKYGNAISEVDEILKEYEDWMCEKVTSFESLYGEKFFPGQFVTGHHGPHGAITIASADGRLSGTTYSDASMSAYPGTDKNGPFAIFTSATVWDHSNSQSSQLNLKLHPTAVAGELGSKKMLNLTRSYLRQGGQHIQYNVVDSNCLRDAQEHPDQYRDLLVRVSGFTQYWCELSKPIQDEVIARTDYEGVG